MNLGYNNVLVQTYNTKDNNETDDQRIDGGTVGDHGIDGS
jgi:hypothetical protein